MHARLPSVLYLAGAFLPLAQAAKNCPLIGPDFPAPRNLSSCNTIARAKSNLDQAIAQTIATNNSVFGLFEANATSFALQIFSTHEADPVYEYYYSAPILQVAESGTKSVDCNTIFRIGSLTKLFTVYTFLLEAGDVSFNEPITKYVPELLAVAQSLNATGDPIDYVAWEDITIGDIASQLSDIGRDYSELGELSVEGVDGTLLGLPPLNQSEIPSCAAGLLPLCSRQQFFAGLFVRHPVYAPSTSPIYSNLNYQILSYALENITGKAFAGSIEDSLFKALNLPNTSYSLPADNSTSVIPNGNIYYAVPLGDETPAGGVYSTVSDGTVIGRSILDSTLLTPAQTRRWMKPHSFNADLKQGVGAPWEIMRMTLPPNDRVIDLYTKTGDLQGYTTILALVPDWDLGFTIFSAGDEPHSNVVALTNLIGELFLPAVEIAAREEAVTNFVGSYVSSDKALNSSITISTDNNKPGLGVTSWISNGTDILSLLANITFAGPNVQLYPTGLKNMNAKGGTILSFRAVYEDLSLPAYEGLYPTCWNWVNVDGTYWGSVASDEWLFTVDASGLAVSATPRITRAELVRI